MKYRNPFHQKLLSAPLREVLDIGVFKPIKPHTFSQKKRAMASFLRIFLVVYFNFILKHANGSKGIFYTRPFARDDTKVKEPSNIVQPVENMTTVIAKNWNCKHVLVLKVKPVPPFLHVNLSQQYIPFLTTNNVLRPSSVL
jgi:hypothetical protein